MSVKLAAIKPLQCGRYMQRHSVRVFFIGYGKSRRESHGAPSCALRRSEKKAKRDTLLWKAVFGFSAAAVSAGSGDPSSCLFRHAMHDITDTAQMSLRFCYLYTHLEDLTKFFSFCEDEFLYRKCAVLYMESHAHKCLEPCSTCLSVLLATSGPVLLDIASASMTPPGILPPP